MRRVLNGLVAACILAVASGNAFSDESGVPFWLSGQYASLSQPALSGSRNDNVSGGTDLYPSASLAWNNGNHNWMSYITGDIPVGTYDPTALSNLGIGALSNEV